MGSLIALSRAVKNIDLNKMLDDAIKQEENYIIGLNTRKQLFEKGIDAMGQPLTPPYAGFTKSIKRFKGQPVDRVTLKDTGDFYQGFFVDINKDYFQISSHDRKTHDLEEKYGENLFGLTKDNISLLIIRIKPNMQKSIRSILKI